MPLPNPVHYYALAESSGTSAAADKGWSPVALSTVSGTPTVVTGKSGNARQFDAGSSIAQAADDASLAVGPAYDWTLAAWIKHDAGSMTPGVGYKVVDRSNIAAVTIYPGSGNPTEFKVTGSDSFERAIASSYGLGNNAWHHVLARYDATTGDFALFADGALAGNFTPSTWGPAADSGTGRWTIGGGPFAAGHLAIFRSAPGGGGKLSNAQVSELYNAGAGNFWSGSAWSASADAIAPTVLSASINSAGNQLAVNFSESVVGDLGFTLSGGHTLGTASGLGATRAFSIAPVVVQGEAITLSYAPGNVEDAVSNKLAAFSGQAVTNNSTARPTLAAGTASFVSSGPAGISVSATAPSNGSGSGPTFQWERNSNGGSYSALSGQTTLAITDATATTPGVQYRYRCKQTRGVEAVTTNAVLAQVYSGGTLTGGGLGGPRVGNSPFIRGI